MANAASSLGRPEVFNNSTGAAFMTFHRTGSYASYFGLDTDNVWKVGGWSAGAVAYKIWHEGNDGAGSGLDADLLDGLQASAFPQLSGAAFTGAVNMPSAPGLNPGVLNVFQPSLGGTATNTKTIATFRTSTSNEDKIIFDAIRHTTGGSWETASLRVRRMVDASNHNFLEFANNGTFIGWGATRRVGIYDTSANAMDVVGKLNMTSAMGVTRGIIDFNYTQSGLTIWNTDNSPLYLGTSGINRMAITAAGEIDLGTNAVQTDSRLRKTHSHLQTPP
jgi:hypothetical protein